MVPGSADDDWRFRADFSVDAWAELRIGQSIFAGANRARALEILGSPFRLPYASILSLILIPSMIWYAFGQNEVAAALSKLGTAGIVFLVLIELAGLALVFGLTILLRRPPRKDLIDRLRSVRSVSFTADREGYRWQAPGLLIQGDWSSVDALWTGQQGFALVSGASIAFVPRHVFPTETDFAAQVDMMSKLARTGDPIRIGA